MATLRQLPAHPLDSQVALDNFGTIWQYDALIGSWVDKGAISIPGPVTEASDGIVTPEVFRKLAYLNNVYASNPISFVPFKIQPGLDAYWYYFRSSNKLFRFIPEGPNKLRIEVDRGRIYQILMKQSCPGAPGPVGDPGVAGHPGITGAPEVGYIPSEITAIDGSQGDQLNFAIFVPCPITTDISLRLHRVGSSVPATPPHIIPLALGRKSGSKSQSSIHVLTDQLKYWGKYLRDYGFTNPHGVVEMALARAQNAYTESAYGIRPQQVESCGIALCAPYHSPIDSNIVAEVRINPFSGKVTVPNAGIGIAMDVDRIIASITYNTNTSILCGSLFLANGVSWVSTSNWALRARQVGQSGADGVHGDCKVSVIECDVTGSDSTLASCPIISLRADCEQEILYWVCASILPSICMTRLHLTATSSSVSDQPAMSAVFGSVKATIETCKPIYTYKVVLPEYTPAQLNLANWVPQAGCVSSSSDRPSFSFNWIPETDLPACNNVLTWMGVTGLQPTEYPWPLITQTIPPQESCCADEYFYCKNVQGSTQITHHLSYPTSTTIPALHIYSTGVDDVYNLLPDRAMDPHYKVTASADPWIRVGSPAIVSCAAAPKDPQGVTVGAAALVNDNWQVCYPGHTTSPLAGCISVAYDTTEAINGEYDYTTTFNVEGFDPTSINFQCTMICDDAVAGCVINNNVIPGSSTVRPSGSGPNVMLTWSLPSNGFGIVDGINTLVFKTLNLYNVITWFFASIKVTHSTYNWPKIKTLFSDFIATYKYLPSTGSGGIVNGFDYGVVFDHVRSVWYALYTSNQTSFSPLSGYPTWLWDWLVIDYNTRNVVVYEFAYGASEQTSSTIGGGIAAVPGVTAVLGVTTVLGVLSGVTSTGKTGIIGVTTVLGTVGGQLIGLSDPGHNIPEPASTAVCLVEYDSSGALVASFPLTLVPNSYSYQISSTQLAKSAPGQIVWRGTAMHYFHGSSSAVPSTSSTICVSNDIVSVPVVYEIFCWSPPTTAGSASLTAQNLGSLAVTSFPSTTVAAVTTTGVAGTANLILFVSFPVCPTGGKTIASPDAAGMGAEISKWNCGTFIPSQSNSVPAWVRTLVFTLSSPCNANMIMNPTGLVFNTAVSLGPYANIATISLTDAVICNKAMAPIAGSALPTEVLGSGSTGTLGLATRVLSEFNHTSWNLVLAHYSNFAMILHTSGMFVSYEFLGPDGDGYFYGVCYVLTLTNSIILTLTRYFYEKYFIVGTSPMPQWNGPGYSFDPLEPTAPVCGASDLSVVVIQSESLSGHSVQYTFTFPSYQPTGGILYGDVDFASPIDTTLAPGFVHLGSVTYNLTSLNYPVVMTLTGTSNS